MNISSDWRGATARQERVATWAQNALQFSCAQTRHWPSTSSCLHRAGLNRSCNLCRARKLRGTLYGWGRCWQRPESENDVDIYTIIFLALAVFIFLRLRSVLGQRTGSERPPFDRAARNAGQGAQDNNVVPMPGKVIDQAPLAPTADVAPPSDRWKGLAESGTPLAQGLDGIAVQH